MDLVLTLLLFFEHKEYLVFLIELELSSKSWNNRYIQKRALSIQCYVQCVEWKSVVFWLVPECRPLCAIRPFADPRVVSDVRVLSPQYSVDDPKAEHYTLNWTGNFRIRRYEINRLLFTLCKTKCKTKIIYK